MKKILVNIVLSILAIGWCVGVYFLHCESEKARETLSCNKINVRYEDSYRFLTESDIKGVIDRDYGSYIGQRLDSVNLKKIEDILNREAVVKVSQAFVENDGSLNVVIGQREPEVRFQKSSYGFYADKEGVIFPLQEKYTFLVPVIEGNIPLSYAPGYKGYAEEGKDSEWMNNSLNLIRYLKKSKVWSENIVQINVLDNGDFVLIPRDGDEHFIFGAPVDIEKKFARINRYYQYIKPSDEYKTVNVKYAGQIICRK